jgi:hypothetical protein
MFLLPVGNIRSVPAIDVADRWNWDLYMFIAVKP